jgi:hypothetical protein
MAANDDRDAIWDHLEQEHDYDVEERAGDPRHAHLTLHSLRTSHHHESTDGGL